MSSYDPAPEQVTTAEQPAYSQLSAEPAVTAQHEPYRPSPADDGAPAGQDAGQDDYLDDEEEEWVSQAPKGWRVRGTTGVLLLLLFGAGGFWAGAVVQKHHHSAGSSGASASSRFAALAGRGAAGTGAAGRAAASGQAAGAGAAGGGFTRGATVGIVTTIEGSTVYLTDSSGNLVKVTANPSSTVTKTVGGTLADLQPGQTVVVQGSKAADGSTTARSITIAPAGSGLGAGGRFGGGSSGGGGSGGGGG